MAPHSSSPPSRGEKFTSDQAVIVFILSLSCLSLAWIGNLRNILIVKIDEIYDHNNSINEFRMAYPFL